MPADVVKTEEDEEKWEKAKGLAEDQGEAENWAYIMGIYKKMCPDYDFEDSTSRCGFDRRASLSDDEIREVYEGLLKLGASRPEHRPKIHPLLVYLSFRMQ